MKKGQTAEEIIKNHRQGNLLITLCKPVTDLVRTIGVTEFTSYRLLKCMAA